jgi:hypothetical protein
MANSIDGFLIPGYKTITIASIKKGRGITTTAGRVRKDYDPFVFSLFLK